MNWQTLSKEQKQYIFLGSVVAIALIYVLYTVAGSLLATDEKGAEKVDLEALEGEVASAERTLRKERPIIQEYEEVQRYLDEVSAYFPNEDNRYSWVTELIYTQGRNYGIEVENITELGRQETPGADLAFGRYAVQVNLRCRYDRLIQFVKFFEDDNPMLRITQLSIVSDDKDPVNHSVKLIMEWPTSLSVQQAP
ncbi:MAG: hypothetical protein PHP44_06950 [Kiritimatiellae bacterium]|nr:hypothetical protein [Kiritimatiellia bacterium]